MWSSQSSVFSNLLFSSDVWLGRPRTVYIRVQRTRRVSVKVLSCCHGWKKRYYGSRECAKGKLKFSYQCRKLFHLTISLMQVPFSMNRFNNYLKLPWNWINTILLVCSLSRLLVSVLVFLFVRLLVNSLVCSGIFLFDHISCLRVCLCVIYLINYLYFSDLFSRMSFQSWILCCTQQLPVLNRLDR